LNAACAVVDLLFGSVCFLTEGFSYDLLFGPATRWFARRRGRALYPFDACWRIVEVSQGTIKKLTDKGFGFIEGERGDIFFHSSSVQGTGYDSLYEGQAVSYTEGQGPKGKRAENVQPVA
jgi:CspA family cold shock protein